MKRILRLLLALALACVCLAAAAEEGDQVSLELNTGRLQVYAAGDPYLSGLTDSSDGLPVIVLATKRSAQLQVNVLPKTVRNRKVDFAVDNEEVARVRGDTLTGVAPGEAVVTITSQADPEVSLRYRVVVITAVNRISMTSSAKSVAAGGTVELTPSVLPEDATMKQVTWSSANEQIATVDQNGVVTGVKRGTARITAMAADGSNIRANISIQVTQNAEEITLDKDDTIVSVGRSAVLRATVLPKETNNKRVTWTSSDESIAKVNAQGRITGVAPGDCEIICTSQEVGTVTAKAVVHVQQPVHKVAFSDAPAVYNGETAQLVWTVEPANATNQKLTFSSSNEKILTVSEDGVVTGVAGGEAYVRAITTDGSNRQARVRVKVYQHVTGVHMYRHTAYIDVGQTSTAGAVLEPEKAKNINNAITWESADESIATVKQNSKAHNKADIKGISYGDTVITGTTVDGGFQTTLKVKIGDWENSLKWSKASIDGKGNIDIALKNVSSLNITSITVTLECYDFDGKAEKGVNSKDGSNTFKAVYRGTLSPGSTTSAKGWKLVDFDKGYANTNGIGAIVFRVTEFQIDNDWVKTVRKNNRKMKTTYDPHRVL